MLKTQCILYGTKCIMRGCTMMAGKTVINLAEETANCCFDCKLEKGCSDVCVCKNLSKKVNTIFREAFLLPHNCSELSSLPWTSLDMEGFEHQQEVSKLWEMLTVRAKVELHNRFCKP